MVKVALDPLVNVPMVHAPVLLLNVPALGVVLPIGIACWQYITNRYGCSCTWSCIVVLRGKDYVTPTLGVALLTVW
jgi:hypothetical protein